MTVILATTQLSPTAEALTLMVVGMGVVFVSLVLLLGLVALIHLFSGPDTPPPAPAPGNASQSAQAARGQISAGQTSGVGGMTPQTVAVIAAAATAALQRPVQVTQIKARS